MRSSARTLLIRNTARREPNYNLYIVNFYDNGLNAVREEFVKRVKDGLRRSVFVIDIEKEIIEANEHNAYNIRNSRIRYPETKPTDPLGIVLFCIDEHCKQYDAITRKIEEEMRFNLYKYYMSNMNVQVANERPKNGTRRSEKPEKKKSVGGDNASLNIVCYGISPKEHNKVGKGQLLSKRMYIEDQPLNSKLFIVLIGKIDNSFIFDLLKLRQPIRAIIDFMPEECAYDLLVPRPRREKFLQDTLENIHQAVNSLRKRHITKSIGIMQQQLPVMSTCLASKYSQDIFDQLCYYLYDVDLLHEWYNLYYVKPFKEINVQMSATANLKDTYYTADSLSMQGHYLKTPFPAVTADDPSLYMYMEGLMSTFGQPRDLLTEIEVLLLANPTPSVQTRVLDKIKVYEHAFFSTLKLRKTNRLIIEETNSLLSKLLGYAVQLPLQNLYHSCLEYNILRRYFSSGYIFHSLKIPAYNGELEPFLLNRYAKLCLTHDSVLQRELELIEQYPDYKVECAYPNVTIFSFKRVLNEVFEEEKETAIPTRLCFRDFTLFEMEKFLESFVTPATSAEAREKYETHKSEMLMSQSTLLDGEHNEMIVRIGDGRDIKIDLSLFVRPNSLKARQTASTETDAKDCREHRPSLNLERPTARQKSKRKASGSLGSIHETTQFSVHLEETRAGLPQPGLPADHPMLRGYNLDDTRQIIKTKTSKYHYEEGTLQLFEERWNFTHTNKTLSLSVNKVQLHLQCPKHDTTNVSRNFRIRTPNELCMRVFTEDKECAKIVINYPTGLSVYCHKNHAEQVWNQPDSRLDERRRVFTPYGCVIVYYNSDDMVLIMRYNGEVYHLYNYIEEGDEEEEGLSELNNLISNTSTGGLDTETLAKQQKPKKKPGSKRAKGGGLTYIVPPQIEEITPPTERPKTSKRKKPAKQAPKLNKQQMLLASIEHELGYLEFIMALYGLSYLHLKVTTSMGKVVHLLKTGKVYAGTQLSNVEWRDYYANEDYAMRSDGVKLLWTADSFKCYHSDGTVIITKTIEGVEGLVDAYDKLISQSSSHENMNVDSPASIQSAIYINAPAHGSLYQIPNRKSDLLRVSRLSKVTQRSLQTTKSVKMTDFLVNEEAEEPYYYDPLFVTYMPNVYYMHHHIYATIIFTFETIDDNMKTTTEVHAADNLKVKIYEQPIKTEFQEEVEEEASTEHSATDDKKTEPSSIADMDASMTDNTESAQKTFENDIPETSCVEIECDDLKIKYQYDFINIEMVIRRFGCSENVCIIRDVVKLKMIFNESLSAIFRNWVKKLIQFINCCCPKVQDTYFVEQLLDDCKKRGFELISKLPPLRKYNFCTSNVVLDIDTFQSIHERLENYYQWLIDDMLKYPRFRKRTKKTADINNFPTILGVTVYVEVPRRLATKDRIHQFVDPFDKITFKRLKNRLTEAILYHQHPQLNLLLMKEISKASWRQRLLDQKREKFVAQQRIGLYKAMLRHKVYPNYFQFTEKLYSHVRNIDFFEFMAMKCNEKSNPTIYQDKDLNKPDEQDESKFKPEETKKRRRGKKCACPKYPF